MKILIIGAGVMGSIFAGKLALAGEEVTVLARGKRVTQLKEDGIVLKDAFSNKKEQISVTVVETINKETNYDLIAVHVRLNQLPSILPILNKINKNSLLLFMVNNPLGFDELAEKLGDKRIIVGFPGGGGMMENDGTINYALAPGLVQPTTFGELDGEITKRIKTISALYKEAGFPTAISSNIDAWLKTHAVVILGISCALYKSNGDGKTLAKNTETLKSMIQGIKEGFSVLKELTLPITPPSMKLLFQNTPEPILLCLMRLWFNSRKAEVFMGRHTRNAPDEVRILAEDFQKLTAKSKIATPTLMQLYSYIPKI